MAERIGGRGASAVETVYARDMSVVRRVPIAVGALWNESVGLLECSKNVVGWLGFQTSAAGWKSHV